MVIGRSGAETECEPGIYDFAKGFSASTPFPAGAMHLLACYSSEKEITAVMKERQS